MIRRTASTSPGRSWAFAAMPAAGRHEAVIKNTRRFMFTAPSVSSVGDDRLDPLPGRPGSGGIGIVPDDLAVGIERGLRRLRLLEVLRGQKQRGGLVRGPSR